MSVLVQVGGNTNFLVAASRLGLRTASVGHLGQDVYGQFMQDVLKVCCCPMRLL